MDWTRCPDPGCGALAEVQWRSDVLAGDEAVEVAKVWCVNRHHFLLPSAMLPAALEAPPAEQRGRRAVTAPQDPTRDRLEIETGGWTAAGQGFPAPGPG